jgi:hypothetical protein
MAMRLFMKLDLAKKIIQSTVISHRIRNYMLNEVGINLSPGLRSRVGQSGEQQDTEIARSSGIEAH